MIFRRFFTLFLCLASVFATLSLPAEFVYAQGIKGKSSEAASSTIDTIIEMKLPENGLTQTVSPPKDPQNVVYLTFDDGPDPQWTYQVLDILQRYRAHATFYMIGSSVVSHPEIVREVASRAQTIGVHGFNHADLSTAGFNFFYNELHDTESAIMESLQGDQNLTQQFGRCLRPPYGKKSDLLYANAEAMGYEVSMWNIDTKDWSGRSPEDILAHFRTALEPQKVILMHDGGLDRTNTLQALELILHELLMQGYTVLPYCTQQGQAIKTSN